MRTQQKQRIETLGDPRGVKQYHWNTGEKENHQLNPSGPRKKQKVGAMIVSEHRPTSVQFKEVGKVGNHDLITAKQADCSMKSILYAFCLLHKTISLN